MNEFYKAISKQHLKMLTSEREYYRYIAEDAENREADTEGYKLMIDFYDVIVEAAKKHIADHS